MIEQGLRVVGVAVGDVDQPQGRCSRVVGQGHLGAQLREHQSSGHAPLGVCGVGVWKAFHRLAVLPLVPVLAAGLRGVLAAALGVTRALSARGTAWAWACCPMS